MLRTDLVVTIYGSEINDSNINIFDKSALFSYVKFSFHAETYINGFSWLWNHGWCHESPVNTRDGAIRTSLSYGIQHYPLRQDINTTHREICIQERINRSVALFYHDIFMVKHDCNGMMQRRKRLMFQASTILYGGRWDARYQINGTACSDFPAFAFPKKLTFMKKKMSRIKPTSWSELLLAQENRAIFLRRKPVGLNWILDGILAHVSRRMNPSNIF